MPCFAAPKITIDISAIMPSLSLPSPSIGLVIPCCNIPISLLLDMTLANQAIALIFAAAAAILQPILQPIIMFLAKYLGIVNAILDKIQFSCPL